MAQFTITIPDEHLQRVQDAGINKAWVLKQIKDAVKAHESKQLIDQANAQIESVNQNTTQSIADNEASVESISLS